MIDPNTAETLNKALDLAKQGVVAAFETVKTYAPVVWGMARRQVQLEGYECIFGWCIVAVAYSASIASLYSRELDSRNSYHFDAHDRCFLACALSVIFAIITGAVGVAAIDLLGNPDWWTMLKVLELVKR